MKLLCYKYQYLSEELTFKNEKNNERLLYLKPKNHRFFFMYYKYLNLIKNFLCYMLYCINSINEYQIKVFLVSHSNDFCNNIYDSN